MICDGGPSQCDGRPSLETTMQQIENDYATD